jgi:hypothetical protein
VGLHLNRVNAIVTCNFDVPVTEIPYDLACPACGSDDGRFCFCSCETMRKAAADLDEPPFDPDAPENSYARRRIDLVRELLTQQALDEVQRRTMDRLVDVVEELVIRAGLGVKP